MKQTAIFLTFLLLSSPAFAGVDVASGTPQNQGVQIENPNSTPLTLADCFKLSLNQSETVGIRKQEIEVARAQFFKATGVFFGDIDFITQEQFQDGSGPGGAGGQTNATQTFNAERRRTRQFTIDQPLFQGFKSLGAVTGAGALDKQRKNEYIRSKQDLFLEVAKAFYDILLFKRDIANIEETRTLFQERINELNEREQIGRSRPSEVVNAVSRLKNLEGDLAQSRGGLQIARVIMEYLTGVPVDISRIKEEDLESIIQNDPNDYIQAAEARPDVIAAKNEVTVAWDAIIVAQSGLWPTLGFVTDHYELREGFQSPITWDFTLQMDVPLFRGGENIGLIKEAIAKWKQAKLKYSLVKRTAEREVKQSYEQWYASYQQYKSFDEGVQASTEDFKLQKEDYTRSLVSNLDVLDALERLNTNRRQANRTNYAMKKDYWALKVAMGETL